VMVALALKVLPARLAQQGKVRNVQT
jgi:hypothetical protein